MTNGTMIELNGELLSIVGKIGEDRIILQSASGDLIWVYTEALQPTTETLESILSRLFNY